VKGTKDKGQKTKDKGLNHFKLRIAEGIKFQIAEGIKF
jgi:hypothetical protein